MNGIMGIGHVAYNVSDMNASLDFYVNRLGFEHSFSISRDDGTPWIEYLRVAPGQFIELFYSDKAPEGGYYNHLCLQVEDCVQTVEALMKNGVVIDVMPKQGKDLNVQAWIRDPDGNKVELMQLSPPVSTEEGGKMIYDQAPDAPHSC